MANNESQGGNNQSFLILCGAMLMFLIGFYLFRDQLVSMWLLYVRMEGYLVLLTNIDPNLLQQAEQLIQWTYDARVEDVTAADITYINSTIIGGSNHNFIFVILVIVSGYFIKKKWGVYKGAPTLKSLLATEHLIWPTQEFVKRFDPSKEWKSELRGIGRYPLTPFIHGVENGYLRNMGASDKNERVFDEEKCTEVFIDIIGEKTPDLIDIPAFYKATITLVAGKWLGLKAFPQYNELLRFFAIELSYVKISNVEMEAYLNKVLNPLFEYLAGKEKPNVSDCPLIIKELISALKKDHAKCESILKDEPFSLLRSVYKKMELAHSSHCYLKTYMIGLLVGVKEGGKFPPGRLVFLRPWERELYLIISNAPYFQSDVEERYRFISGFSVEVIGIFAQYQHEKYARRRVADSKVYNAVAGVKKRLLEQNLIGE